MFNILDLTLDELILIFETQYQKGKYHANATYREIFRNGNCELRKVKEFQESAELAILLENDIDLNSNKVKQVFKENETEKFIFTDGDNQEYETVVVPMKSYKTLCISSQIGCKMGCTFCETGKMGFIRDLSVKEIIEQVYYAKVIKGLNIKNIVFMGMGEPLDNFNNLIKSINILTEPKGLNFSPNQITVSTVGIIKNIEKFANQKSKINLAISLNASNDIIRSEIMPINKNNSLTQLRYTLENYPLKHKGIFFIEYVLISGINDSIENAEELSEYLKDLPVKVNLIPYNKSKDSIYDSPSDETINSFFKVLQKNNIFARKRISKGRDIQAGCGQLNTVSN